MALSRLPLLTLAELRTYRNGKRLLSAGVAAFTTLILWFSGMRNSWSQMKPKLAPYGMVRGATFINVPDASLNPEVYAYHIMV